MSSEMRKIVADMRLYGGDKLEGSRLERLATHWADQIEALLARTEAGADGWPEYVMLRDTKLNDDMGGLGQRIFTTAGAGYEKRKYVRADLTTHPQDASGDAEVLTAHGIKALDRCCGELRKFIELAGDYDLDEMSVQALETAIESMEMRKAAAMQAKEAK